MGKTISMAKKKIYIAGKVTGELRHDAVVKFERAELQWRKTHRVVNPMSIVPPGAGWKVAMRQCMMELLECDSAYFLRDWKQSQGAQAEHYMCEICGIEIIYEADA